MRAILVYMDGCERVRMGSGGWIELPPPIMDALGLVEGTQLTVSADQGRMIIESRDAILLRLRRRFRDVDVSLAAEVAADRRADARVEDAT